MIPIATAEISDLEKKYVMQAIENSELSGRAPVVKKFEESFAKYIGAKYSCAVPNGTIALHLALVALDIGPGDEVIVPSSTISSCIFAIHYTGATAVIVDVDKDTWCMNPKLLEKAITKNTKAIMPVDLYGLMADIHEIRDFIAQKYDPNIAVVEDFAEAIGSSQYSHKAGSYFDTHYPTPFLGCCSLFFNKVIQAGEGGVVTTNSDKMIEKLRYYRDLGFGKTPETKFFANDLAYNYRPNGLAMAFALAQIERVDYLVERRQKIHNAYIQYLSPKFIWQKVPKEYFNTYWMEAVLVSNSNDATIRNRFMEYMKEKGIETRPSFPPLGMHAYLKTNFQNIKHPYRIISEDNSTYIWNNAVLLPSGGSDLTEDKIKYICECANKFMG